MKKLQLAHILILVSFLIGITKVTAQQDLLVTQFWNVKNYFNPAAAGMEFKIQANAFARWQWVGVNGAPNSQMVNYSMKLDRYNSGIGVNYLHDNIGFSNTNRLKINYSYLINFKNDSKLFIGATAGINNLKTIGYWVLPTTVEDSTFNGNFSQNNFLGDLGMMYSKNKFNIGFSITQLTKQKSSDQYRFAKHYHLMTDYLFKLNDELELKTQILLKSDFVKISADINWYLIMWNKFWAGLTLRPADAVCVSLGYNLKDKYRVSYSYDITTNKLQSVSKGSQEVHLGFYLK